MSQTPKKQTLETQMFIEVNILIFFICYPCIMSSPELKDQVRFVCHPSVHKLYIFEIFSRTLGQFQPNFVQNILGWRTCMFVKIKGHALFQMEDKSELLKFCWSEKNLLIKNQLARKAATCVKAFSGSI